MDARLNNRLEMVEHYVDAQARATEALCADHNTLARRVAALETRSTSATPPSSSRSAASVQPSPRQDPYYMDPTVLRINARSLVSGRAAHDAGVSNHAGHRAISDVVSTAACGRGATRAPPAAAPCCTECVPPPRRRAEGARAGNAEGAAAERARAAQQAAVYEASTFKKAVDAMQEMEKWGR